MSAVPSLQYRFQPMVETSLSEVVAIEDAIYEFPWTLGNFRDSLKAISAARITAPNGAQVPLQLLANLSFAEGPTEIKSETGRLIGYVFVDLATRDIGGYVARADSALKQQI